MIVGPSFFDSEGGAPSRDADATMFAFSRFFPVCLRAPVLGG